MSMHFEFTACRPDSVKQLATCNFKKQKPVLSCVTSLQKKKKSCTETVDWIESITSKPHTY